MVSSLMSVLSNRAVDYIRAPYEADSQLTYLCIVKFVDMVLSEDSDVLPPGVPQLLWIPSRNKKDQSGTLYRSDKITEQLSFPAFQMVCVLSRCEYSPRLRIFGIESAFNAML